MTENTKKSGKIRVQAGRNIVPILKIKVDSARKEELLNRVERFLEFEAVQAQFGLFIVTPNPEIIVSASKNPDLASVLNSADLSLPDGTGLIIATRGKIASRVTGTDFARSLIDLAKTKGWRVCLLGGDQTVSSEAKNRILKDQTVSTTPGFEILALEGPRLTAKGEPVDQDNRRSELKTLVEINKFEPHILLVGFGNPKQELWVQRNRHELEAGVTMVVGGAFDFWSGKVARAPRILREIGLEWLWRLIQEPSRWRRQLKLLEFLKLVILEKLWLYR